MFHAGSRFGSFCGIFLFPVKLTEVKVLCEGVVMSAGNNMEKSSGKKIMYKKECTVVLDVGENKKITAGELIDFLCDDVGVVIHACVPKGADRYEVTVEDIIQARMIYESDSLKLNGFEMKARLLYSESVVV